MTIAVILEDKIVKMPFMQRACNAFHFGDWQLPLNFFLMGLVKMSAGDQ